MATDPYAPTRNGAPTGGPSAGAFAVEEEVSWTNGFDDEDLAGQQPAPAQAAPRPAQPVSRVLTQPSGPPAGAPVGRPLGQPVGQPVGQPTPVSGPPGAPVRTPVRPPAAPRPPAPTQPPTQGLPAAQPQTPAQPPATPPQVTAPPGAPRPTAPVQPTTSPQLPVQPRPVQPQVPVQPRPVQPQAKAPEPPAVPPPVQVPATAPPPTGVPERERITEADLAEPDWARIRPATENPAVLPTPVEPLSRRETPPLAPPTVALDADHDFGTPPTPQTMDPGTDGPYLPAPVTYVQPEAAPQQTRRARKGGKPKGKQGPPNASGQRGQAMAGGRWKIKVFRGLVFAFLGLMILSGARHTFLPSKGPTVEEITAAVSAELGQNGFPVESGEAFAIRFARTYLTYDQASAETRAAQLAAYSTEASKGTWGWNGQGAQAVTNGPLVAAPVELVDKNNATVTVAAQVDNGNWVYLAVPVYAHSDGSLAISGPPAFVAPPMRATAPGDAVITQPDEALGQEITDVLSGYFTAWAASDQAALSRYVTPEATTEATSGLGDTVTLGTIGAIKMPRDGGDIRQGTVEVTWATETAGAYTQSYRITVEKSGDGRWYVADIKGGKGSSGTATTGAATAP